MIAIWLNYINLLKNKLLKNYFVQYKPFLIFLAKFFVVYLLLTFGYQQFLNQYDTKQFEVDSVTKLVAKQSVFVMKWFDASSKSTPNFLDTSVKLYYKNTYVSRVVEGCNAISIMILFVSFVVSFSGKLKPTILFLIAGILLIHLINVLRIALLNVLIFNYPNQKQLLHGVVFPLLIYGIVFGLWVIWVNKFSHYAKK